MTLEALEEKICCLILYSEMQDQESTAADLENILHEIDMASAAGEISEAEKNHLLELIAG